MKWAKALELLPRYGRHRPGYFRDYYRLNRKRLRPYLAAKAREYRAAK